MKKLVYLTIYAAIYAQTGALGIANNAQPSTGLVAREIQIHAPNSITLLSRINYFRVEFCLAAGTTAD